MNLSESVAAAVAAFQAQPASDDDVIFDALAAQGIAPETIRLLIQFIPIAFCRIVMGPLGVRFAAEYTVMSPKGKLLARRPIDDEPIYREALAQGKAALAEGRGPDDFLLIAARSGGYQAIQQLLAKGGRPESIITSPPILMGEEPATRRWWRFWK